ncbi:Uncharacterised protein [Chlamydia trachomatis]|nr:Uncharacterised protein [Chlamydia trachomatis]
MQVVLLVLADVHLGRVEAIATQKSEKPHGQIIHFALHEADFLLGNHHAGHIVDLLLQHLSKTFGILGVVAVKKSVFYLATRVGLQNIIETTIGVGIVIGEVGDDLSHCR